MLHELLSENREEIVWRCERKLRERHPDRPRDELLDTIPAFLDELIKAERRIAGLPETTDLPYQSEHARAHGQQRFHRGYAISELPHDFGTISDAIGELAIENDLHLDAPSYKLLNECIDNAISQSITEYFMLSRASEAQGVATWIGSLGHELRNSVSTALMAYAALDGGHVGIHSRTAKVLERSLHRIESLVSRTLAAMQLKSGTPLQREPVNLRELVEDIIETLVLEHHVSIEVDVDPTLILFVDMRLLESALSNLVQNAVKFTHELGVVYVRARQTNEAVAIEVEDECGGLGNQDPEVLFEAFVQGDRRTGGVGLGLAITRQAIEAHGGQVQLTDLSPKGCRFTVWLPR
ncbi:MAG TPA: HAMP domain-containing sensor histidine kinase [Kofleriaceae bacterium]